MTATFQWMTQNVAMPSIDRAKVEAWLVEVAKAHGRIAHELSYIFCDDARIIEVNREFLQHDYYTDIITFDYSHGRVISGDMFISLDTVASNAVGIGAEFRRNFCASSCMGCCTCAASTTKARANAKSWSVTKTRPWRYTLRCPIRKRRTPPASNSFLLLVIHIKIGITAYDLTIQSGHYEIRV